ncbi:MULTISPECIES: HEAT repeat domain-containing protein [unclassified Chamaesiphon]|uniref:HEAT repeat domain-containing protein n=1 Tax=unclassified Chamaesiphon TaxID=2620921 RepID=UPI00286ABFC3|nr:MULTISPECIES: HEAT repeat domain-containing protein [unclassified Chamaesiphon]
MNDFNEDIQITDRELLHQLNNLSDRDSIAKYLSQPRYNDLLLAMMPLVENKDRAIRIIELTWEVNKKLASRLAGAAQSQFQSETVGRLRELIDLFTQGQSYGLHSKINFLAATNSELVIPELSGIFDYRAIQALKVIASQKELGSVAVLAEAALIKDLENPNVHVREMTANALGDLGSNSAIPLLIKNLQEHPDFSMRMKAATALGKIGDRDTVDTLLVALQDKHEYVRGCAAEALGLLKDDRAIEPLLIALEDRYYWGVRTSAAQALGKLGSIQAIEPLIQMLVDSEPMIRFCAAAALGDLGSDLSVEPLIQALADEHPQVRKDAAEALGKIGNERAIEVLESQLREGDLYIRQGAINGLGKINSERSIQSLFDSFNSHDPDLCDRIAGVLTSDTSKRQIELLIDILQNGFYRARGRSAEILGKIGEKQAIYPLILAAQSENCWIRIKAIRSLARIGNDESVEVLIKALQDPSHNIRKNVTLALRIIGQRQAANLEQVIDPLIIAIQDSSHAVRMGAAATLGVIGSDRAMEPLIDSLQSEHHQIRLSAFYAVVGIYGINNKLTLRLSLQSQFQNVRSAMARLLPQVDYKIAIFGLSAAMEHSNRKVRNDASRYNFFGTVISRIETKENFSTAIDLAIKGLQHKDIRVRINTVQSLIRTPTSSSLDEGLIAVTAALVDCLDFRSYVRRSIVVKALGAVGQQNAIEPLLSILKNEQEHRANIREDVVDSLQQIVLRLGKNISNSQKSLIAEGLTDAIKDESWKGRERASILLAKIHALD